MNDKNRKTTTIKQTFSYGKSKTVTVEVVQKKKKINKDIPLNKTEEKNYINGKQEGLWTKFFEETGIKKEETFYKDGVQQGLWTEWYSDGQ